MQRLGLRCNLDLKQPGFYPRGGGVLLAQIEPCLRLQGLLIDKIAAPKKITGISAVAGLPEDIADRQTRQAIKRLRDTKLEVDIRQETWKSAAPSTMLALEAGNAAGADAVLCAGRARQAGREGRG